jgi:hypothetical protein
MSTQDLAGRARATAERRRAKRLKEAVAKLEAYREKNPLPQGLLGLDDLPLSRREHLERVRAQLFGGAP